MTAFNSLFPLRAALAAIALIVAVASIAPGQSSRRNSAVSYCLRGVEHHRRGEIDLAMADFNMALKFDPAYATAYYNRGVANIEGLHLYGWAASLTLSVISPKRYGWTKA